jgi:hypothetical protein
LDEQVAEAEPVEGGVLAGGDGDPVDLEEFLLGE